MQYGSICRPVIESTVDIYNSYSTVETQAVGDNDIGSVTCIYFHGKAEEGGFSLLHILIK